MEALTMIQPQLLAFSFGEGGPAVSPVCTFSAKAVSEHYLLGPTAKPVSSQQEASRLYSKIAQNLGRLLHEVQIPARALQQ